MTQINTMPCKTFRFLGVNENSVNIDSIEICDTLNINCPDNIKHEQSFPLENMKAIITSCGVAFDNFTKSSMAVPHNFIIEDDSEKNIIYIDNKSSSSGASILHFHAKENSSCTIVEDFSESAKNDFLCETKIYAEKNAKINIVQILNSSENNNAIFGIGGFLYESANVNLLQIIKGEGKTFTGAKMILRGKDATFNIDSAFDLGKNAKLDMNYEAVHEGVSSISDMNVNGVLRDNASKIYRGTINFIKGAKNASGKELEDVLLLSDNCHNISAPIILCTEEDVEGAHGATIGKLDEQTLFYMQSRGLSESEASELIAHSKIEKVINMIKDLNVNINGITDKDVE